MEPTSSFKVGSESQEASKNWMQIFTAYVHRTLSHSPRALYFKRKRERVTTLEESSSRWEKESFA